MIEEIETRIFEQATATEFVWTSISRELLNVRNDDLFTEKTDDRTGKPYKSWDSYLRYLSRELKKRISSGSVSTIKAWMTKYEIYDNQMAYPEEWLQEMGSHANVLLQVANLTRGRVLEKEDRPLPNGGIKLGLPQFKVLCDRIYDNVTNSTGPEDEWTIADTKAEVNKYLGNEPTVQKEWDVKLGDNNLVYVLNLRYIVGDFEYEFGGGKDPILLDHFQKITKGPHHRVIGLPTVY